MDAVGGIFTAFGLSASAGLNAYLPLLIVSLMARFTHWFDLSEPWFALSSWPVIIALILLSLVEFFADKIPAVNHINDIIQTFIRPAAGAILFAASTSAIENLHPAVSIIAGLLIAGGVHAVKSLAVRPAVTATTASSGNIPVSIAEDILASGISILAIVIPAVITGLVIILTSYAIWLLWRRANAERST
ncbi:MAG: DUF4126 domain-containing protein [Anaerolineales bacterium]|nr:DUF4126 domain-containing protein [Anaerolineales bacterium]